MSENPISGYSSFVRNVTTLTTSASLNSPSSASKSFEEELHLLGKKLVEIEEWCKEFKIDNEGLQYVIADLCHLEVKFSDIKDLFDHLETENAILRISVYGLQAEVKQFTDSQSSASSQTILKQLSEHQIETSQLKSEITELKSQLQDIKDAQLLIEEMISIKQQEINSNVTRGVDLKEGVSQAKLLETYEKIRFEALGISIMPLLTNNIGKDNSSKSTLDGVKTIVSPSQTSSDNFDCKTTN